MERRKSVREGRRRNRRRFWAVALCLLLSACGNSDPDAQRQAAVVATLAKIQSCAPNDEGGGDLQLAVTAVERAANETRVRLLAYASGKPAVFDLPTYSLSRGRWLIHETGRAYVLDEKCREYKLKERKSPTGQDSPPDGRMNLAAGQAVETTLNFPPLPDDARIGLLIYDRRTLPFLLSPLLNLETR